MILTVVSFLAKGGIQHRALGQSPFDSVLSCHRVLVDASLFRTILLSVISLLNEPNTSSPANVDASVMYRKWKEGTDMNYADIIK